jgi:hypothetical protein
MGLGRVSSSFIKTVKQTIRELAIFGAARNFGMSLLTIQ